MLQEINQKIQHLVDTKHMSAICFYFAKVTKLKSNHVFLPPVQRLQEDRVSLTQRRDSFRQLLEEMNQKYEALKTKLQENETHAQVRAFCTLHLL